jgi:Flp pilus assembly protein TadD
VPFEAREGVNCMSGTMPPAATSEAPELALARAQTAGQAKRYGEAAGICNDVLAASPDNPTALALLGMISAHTGDPERGVLMLERATGLRAGVAGWYANLSALYRMTYRLQDAARRQGSDPAGATERRSSGEPFTGIRGSG